MGVSWHGGTRSWMVYTGKKHWDGWFGGTPVYGHSQTYGITLTICFWTPCETIGRWRIMSQVPHSIWGCRKILPWNMPSPAHVTSNALLNNYGMQRSSNITQYIHLPCSQSTDMESPRFVDHVPKYFPSNPPGFPLVFPSPWQFHRFTSDRSPSSHQERAANWDAAEMEKQLQKRAKMAGHEKP